MPFTSPPPQELDQTLFPLSVFVLEAASADSLSGQFATLQATPALANAGIGGLYISGSSKARDYRLTLVLALGGSAPPDGSLALVDATLTAVEAVTRDQLQRRLGAALTALGDVALYAEDQAGSSASEHHMHVLLSGPIPDQNGT